MTGSAGPLLLDDFAVLDQLGRGRAAHAQFHEREDRLLVGRVRKAEARLTVPGVEEFRVVAGRRGDVALALGNRAQAQQLVGREAIRIGAACALRQHDQRLRLGHGQRRVAADAAEDRGADEIRAGENALQVVADRAAGMHAVEEEHDPAGQDLGTIEAAVQRRRHDPRAAGKRLDDQQFRVRPSAPCD